MEYKIEKLITEDEVQSKVQELADKINNDYKGRRIIIVGVLKGSVIFLADLVRALNIDINIEFLSVSSYGIDLKSNGEPRLRWDLDFVVKDEDVLIIEDIIDSGYTLKFLKDMFTKLGASSVKVVSMLDKPSRRQVDVTIDYIGFEIDDRFIVGYGLDYANKYRNLRGIYELTMKQI